VEGEFPSKRSQDDQSGKSRIGEAKRGGHLLNRPAQQIQGGSLTDHESKFLTGQKKKEKTYVTLWGGAPILSSLDSRSLTQAAVEAEEIDEKNTRTK